MDIENILQQLRSQRGRLDAAISALEVGSARSGRPAKNDHANSGSPARPRRRMSAEARRRIGLAKKRWWAQQQERKSPGTKSATAKKSTTSKKASSHRRMSAATRKRLSQLAKARWAAKKKQ